MFCFFYLAESKLPDLSVFKVLVSVTVNNAIFTFIIFIWLYYQFFFCNCINLLKCRFWWWVHLSALLLSGVSYQIFPIIALACNIIVSGNSFNYIRVGSYNLKLLFPYLIGSIPFAFIGGSIQVEKELFEILLFLYLLSLVYYYW